MLPTVWWTLSRMSQRDDSTPYENHGLEAQLQARTIELERRAQTARLALLRAQQHELRTPTRAGVPPRVYVARGSIYFASSVAEQRDATDVEIMRIERPDFK